MSGNNGLFKTTGVALELKDVVKHYVSGTERVMAVNGISFDVAPGTPIGLVGVSGCGKSTLLNLVGGVDRPDSGSIMVNGVDVAALREREVEAYRLTRVGFVFQAYNLIPSLTAIQNVMLPMVMQGDLPPAARQERAAALLGLVGLSHKSHKRPDELSGGEQQRVAVGVALSNDPTIILADEPTANLDHGHLTTILTLLQELSHTYKKSVIVATHDPRVWSRLGTVLKIEEGRVVDGAHP